MPTLRRAMATTFERESSSVTLSPTEIPNARTRWRGLLASLGCVVGAHHGGCEGSVELHHVAEGSGLRHDYGLVPLCEGHHRGALGLHKGTKEFIRRFRPPGDSEYGLLVWLVELVAKRAE